MQITHHLRNSAPGLQKCSVLFLCHFSRNKCKFFIRGSWKWWKHGSKAEWFYCFQVFEISDEKWSTSFLTLLKQKNKWHYSWWEWNWTVLLHESWCSRKISWNACVIWTSDPKIYLWLHHLSSHCTVSKLMHTTNLAILIGKTTYGLSTSLRTFNKLH